MMTVEIHLLVYQKGLNQLHFFQFVANQSVFLIIKDVARHALLWKFLKSQILAAEGFKLSSASLPFPPDGVIVLFRNFGWGFNSVTKSNLVKADPSPGLLFQGF
jgi:hypothetical protein